MAGGRGRGRGQFTFNIEAIGFSRGEVLPDTGCQPLPLFPPTEFKPVPLNTGEDVNYILALKQELRGASKKLPYYIESAIAKKDWRRLPRELKPRVKKLKKPKILHGMDDILDPAEADLMVLLAVQAIGGSSADRGSRRRPLCRAPPLTLRTSHPSGQGGMQSRRLVKAQDVQVSLVFQTNDGQIVRQETLPQQDDGAAPVPCPCGLGTTWRRKIPTPGGCQGHRSSELLRLRIIPGSSRDLCGISQATAHKCIIKVTDALFVRAVNCITI
ncbi:DNA-directed RNA polymerase III subunit RPC7 isoform X2 [Scyliorhinus torazame]|uniref:DNA-directed RNA polymerase III subunit RPC7 isoform X2 n=1 Tax=Scyliorhinus torazame TaxID=75743 RepID=UPI003B59B9EF